jgi:hypothetical protein
VVPGSQRPHFHFRQFEKPGDLFIVCKVAAFAKGFDFRPYPVQECGSVAAVPHCLLKAHTFFGLSALSAS